MRSVSERKQIAFDVSLIAINRSEMRINMTNSGNLWHTPLNLYNIFLTTAQTGSLSAASKRLFISQPAVSKAIKQLEDELGITLFFRSSKGVILTDDGELLYSHILSAFNEINAGELLLRSRKELGIGRIRFGASNTLCKYILLPRLQKYVRKNPHISISINCQSSIHTRALIDSRDIDIGLIATPDSQRGLKLYRAGSIHDTFVASPGYIKNLLLRENTNMHNLFQGANLMLLTRDNVTRTYVDSYLNDMLLSQTTLMEIGSMDLLIEFAKTGLGIGCVIREFVKNELESGALMEVTPPDIDIKKREVSYCVNSNLPLSDAAMDFLDNYGL